MGSWWDEDAVPVRAGVRAPWPVRGQLWGPMPLHSVLVLLDRLGHSLIPHLCFFIYKTVTMVTPAQGYEMVHV